MKLTEFSLKKPVTTMMIFLACTVIGLLTVRHLPLEFFPNMEYPYVYIHIPYEDSTPDQVERVITKPVEEIIATLSDIKTIESESGENSSQVFIEFTWGVNATIKSIEAREKIDSIRNILPGDIGRIYIGKWGSADIPLLELRISSSQNLQGEYDLLERHVKRRFERINGISKVELYGVHRKEVRINLNADRLKSHRVDLYSLAEILKTCNFTVSAGSLSDGNKTFIVKPLGELKSLKEIEDIIVSDHSLRLKDIADVSYELPEFEYKRHLNGKYAIGIEIFKESGANIVEVSRHVKKELEKIRKNPVLKGIHIFSTHDSAEAIKSSLRELMKAGILGFFLSILMLYFFLRQFRSTMIVALTVPFSICNTLGFMYFFGLSMNILTMLGLLLAIGMVVDNSVVVSENIFRNRKLDQDNIRATMKGADEVSLAIVAGTFTTVVVFLPNIISESNEITFYLKHIGLSFSVALCSSLIIAQTIVPFLASKITYGKKVEKKLWIDTLSDHYMRILDWLLRHRGVAVVSMVLILVSVYVPYTYVDKEMFASNENRKIVMRYNLNDSYTVNRVEKSIERIETYLLTNKKRFEIDNIYSSFSGNNAKTRIYLKKGKDALKNQQEIQEEIKKDLPEIAIGKIGFKRNSSGGKQEGLSIYITGPSYDLLNETGEDVAWALSNIKKIGDVVAEISSHENELHVHIDPEKIRQYGFSPEDIAQYVSFALRGMKINQIKTRSGETDITVSLSRKDRKNLEDLKNLVIFRDRDNSFTLETLATVSEQKGPSSIIRENRKISLKVSIEKGGLTVDETKEKVEQVLSEFTFPAGVTWGYSSGFEFEDNSMKTMVINIILAFILIYFVMASLFESIVFPYAILFSIFYAVVGVFWFFLATATTFDFLGWTGVLVLIGVVVNNGIVFIDYLNQLRMSGLNRHDAILKAGKDRLRPILMTAGTTILSMIPLCFSKVQIGGDGPPYFPLARAIVGGLTLSTFITLLILPTLYILLDDMVQWFRKINDLSLLMRLKKSGRSI